MKKLENNYAFIDSQNLNLGVQKLGWKLDYGKFRVYLEEKYAVKQAFVFVGFVLSNQKLYDNLRTAGFTVVFKPTIPDAYGKIKGNVDADLVLSAMVEYSKYERAVVVSSDGDFYSLVRFLYKNNKLEAVLSADLENCSNLLKETAKERLYFIADLRELVEYLPPKNEKGSA